MTNELKKKREEVFRQQEVRAFIVAGFYLKDDDIQQLESDMTEDRPRIGALGRYMNAPIYRLADASKAQLPIRDAGEFKYSYVKMTIVN